MIAKKEPGIKFPKSVGHFRSGIANVRAAVINALLLLLAVLLTYLIMKGAFARYANCDYLIVTRLNMDPFFCDGYDVNVFDATLFSIPGLKKVMDPPLELARLAAAGIAILLFASISLFLAVIVACRKSIIRLILFNKDEWGKFMANARIWLLLFVGISLIFYFSAVE